MMILFWVLIIIAAVFLIKNLWQQNENNVVNKKDPEEVVRQRYARGEISENEFKNIMTHLKE